MLHALDYSDVHQTLSFLIAWPDLERAGRLVLARTQELNGDLYELLTPAGNALESKHPLASTLVRRAMIDFTLGAARASRYKHAALPFAECAGMARRIDDFDCAPNHAAYERALRATHSRKAAFWQEVRLV